MYGNGDGVAQSIAISRQWVTKAAEQGYEEAIATLKQRDEYIWSKKSPTPATLPHFDHEGDDLMDVE